MDTDDITIEWCDVIEQRQPTTHVVILDTDKNDDLICLWAYHMTKWLVAFVDITPSLLV